MPGAKVHFWVGAGTWRGHTADTPPAARSVGEMPWLLLPPSFQPLASTSRWLKLADSLVTGGWEMQVLGAGQSQRRKGGEWV